MEHDKNELTAEALKQVTKKISDRNIGVAFDLLFQAISGVQDTVNSHTATLDSHTATLDSQTASLKRLEAAVPGAAAIPDVFLAGNAAVAKQLGATATWTLVKAKTNNVWEIMAAAFDNSNNTKGTPQMRKTIIHPVSPDDAKEDDEFTYFLVSSAHCVLEIADLYGNGDQTPSSSCVFLCNALEGTLMLEGEEAEGGVRVVKVGFHQSTETEGIVFQQQPACDIVFLELDKAPASAEKYDVPIIRPTDELKLERFDAVAGSSLSGRVNGSALHDLTGKNEGMMSFISNFSEPRCSGTVMFGLPFEDGPRALGCFKGHTPKINKPGQFQDRGWLVKFPYWTEIQWHAVEKQLQRIKNTLGAAKSHFN